MFPYLQSTNHDADEKNTTAINQTPSIYQNPIHIENTHQVEIREENAPGTTHNGQEEASIHSRTQSSEETIDAEEVDEQNQLQTYQLTRDRERRETKPPLRFGFSYFVSYALYLAQEIENKEPQTYKEAISCKDSLDWIKAKKTEMNSLLKNQT